MYKEIAQLEGIQAGRKALVAVFKVDSYHRHVNTAKPLSKHALHRQESA